MHSTTTKKIVIAGETAAINHIIRTLLLKNFHDSDIICCREIEIPEKAAGSDAIILTISRHREKLPVIPYKIPVIVYTDSEPKFAIPDGYTLINIKANSAEEIEKLTDRLKTVLSSAFGGKPIRQSPKLSISEPVIKPKAGIIPEPVLTAPGKIRIIAVGASTGGTDAIIDAIKDLPENSPPVVIVQHMPEGFTKMYAERLNKVCRMSAKEAENGDRLKCGQIILAQGGRQMEVLSDANGYYISSKQGEKVSGHCPSVDVLFTSVSKLFTDDAIGVLLTGMGKDGANGLLSMKNAGAYTIGQDESSCVVYGMPCAAYNIGAVTVQLPLSEICRHITKHI